MEFQAQIREQMRLETHFQYEFPILGRFGQSGLQIKKKIQTAISMLLLRPVFFMFSWAKKHIIFFKYPSVRTEKLHDMKLKKELGIKIGHLWNFKIQST